MARGNAVHAVRLRAGTTYSYQVFGTDGAGDKAEGPRGSFTTGAAAGGAGRRQVRRAGGERRRIP